MNPTDLTTRAGVDVSHLLLAPPRIVATECTRCGEELDSEERESPRLDVDETAICDQCYHDNFEFTCSRCEGYGDNEDQHRYLVIFEECGGLRPGIYRINRKPYFISNYFDMWWIKESLSRLRDADGYYADQDLYPSGHLCYGCQREMGLVEATTI